jgi:phosphohistidine phosphatase SixA
VDVEDLRKLIAGSEQRRIICVGHEPNLTTAMLTFTNMHTDGAIELKKGGCYGLRFFDDGPAHLEWMLPPRVLRRR